MNKPSEHPPPEAPDMSGARPVWSRPEPDETMEELSARFLAEILQARRSGERPEAEPD